MPTKKTVTRVTKTPAERAKAKRERQAKKLKLYKSYVKNGIKALDTQFGRKHWLPIISIKELDLSDGNTCICGQMFGDYGVAQFTKITESMGEGWEGEKEGMKDTWARKNGFLLPDSAVNTDYDFLTHVWYVTIFNMKIKAGLLP